MIDSSGKKYLVANGTVFDMLPIGQSVGVLGALLVALFTVVKPEASHGLSWVGRLLFWFLHVALGLGSLWVASRWLSRGKLLPSSTWGAVILSGIAAILIAIPGYIALDWIFSPHILDLDPDEHIASLPRQLTGEFLELAPWFMGSWVLINSPVLLPVSKTEPSMDDSVTVIDEKQSIDEAQRFLNSLPGIVGKDIVAVASDLHYLNVWTVAGRTTVLGSLKEVSDELSDLGMQVHRSHWVAHAHVSRIVGNSSSASCIMSNELRIPVSRRRWKSVKEHYGRGVVNRD